VKPAALITRVVPHDRAVPKPAFELSEKKLKPDTTVKPAVGKAAKRRLVKPVVVAKKSASLATRAGRPLDSRRDGGATKPLPSSAKPARGGRKPSPAIAKTQATQGRSD
jgi:hypothetical protein